MTSVCVSSSMKDDNGSHTWPVIMSTRILGIILSAGERLDIDKWEAGAAGHQA